MNPRIVLRTAITVSLISICAGQACAASVAWQPDWSHAVAQSQRSNHWILVDFYTDWCGWCKKLDKDVYPNPEVVRVMAQYVPVRLNAEKAGKELAKRYRVTGYPTILIVDSSGNVIDRCAGYLKPTDFAAWLQELLQTGGGAPDAPSEAPPAGETPSHGAGVIHMSRIRETTKFRPTYQGDPIEPKPTLALAQKYFDRGDLVEAGRITVKITHGGGSVPAKFYNQLGDAVLQSKKADAAWGWFQMAVKAAKTPEEKALGQLQSARAELALGSVRQAAAHLKSLMASPDASESIKSQAQSLLDEINAPAAR